MPTDEYALTLNRGTKDAQVQKKFDKLDKNDSGFLSEVEFGIKYGDTEGGPEIVSVAESVPLSSVALIVTVYESITVTVPLMRPVSVLMLRPTGRPVAL